MEKLTKKDLRVISKINLNQKLLKKVMGIYSTNSFLADAKSYISATKQNRMFCIIHSISSSGMSRVLNFHSFEGAYYRQYFSFFKSLGYMETKQGFRIEGCGMDMVFATHYDIVHDLYRIGLISQKECEFLCQKSIQNF